MDSIRSTSSQSNGSTTKGSSCAYPSWPTGDSLQCAFGGYSNPSSYISDADLFGGDDFEDAAYQVPYLNQAPSPPRQYAMPPAQVALAPLYAQAKAEKKKSKLARKSSNRTKPMTPIIESPSTPE